MELLQKLEILADAAKYDASCASSGTDKRSLGREGRRHRLHRGHGHLPRLRAGWALHLAAEDPADQFLRLRLPVLHQPPLLQRAPGALHGGGGGHPHAGLLPPQLHRGAVPLLRHHQQPGLHDGAGGRAWPASCGRSTASAATSTSRPSPMPTRPCWRKPGATPTACRSTSSCPPRAAWPPLRRKRTCPASAAPWAACGCASTRRRRSARRPASPRPGRAPR